MSRASIIVLLGICTFLKISAQTTKIMGFVADASTYEKISEVKVSIENSTFETKTNTEGRFDFSSQELPTENQILVFNKPGYSELRLPVSISKGSSLNLDLIPLQLDLFKEQQQISTISLSENELSTDEGGIDNISGLLTASRDVFLNAAAFDFSATFFRPRGIDSEYSSLLINGIEMNKIFDGRPQWSDWGGLNDLQRQQEFSMGMEPGESSFGGLAGTTNIIMRASQYSKGGRISYAASNRSYSGRLMASYSSGEQENGWTYAFLLSRRFAKEAYIEGTIYDANSIMVSVEKKLNAHQSLNFTGFYTPNTRGKSSANTQEVFNLKGRKYNSFWGYQNGKIRNSRIKEVQEPVLMLNHFWKPSKKLQINTNVAYQFGKIGNSRIDYGGTRSQEQPDGQQSFIGGGSNPDPSYYQYLPSYFLRFEGSENYEAAFLAENRFRDNGQIDWQKLYAANEIAAKSGGNSIYIIAEDRNDDQQLWVNSMVKAIINESVIVDAKISYRHLKSENFANVNDLLGGAGYLDIDFFAEGTQENPVGQAAQNDLLHPDRIVTEGDKFKYDFNLTATLAEAFARTSYTSKKLDGYVAANLSNSEYQREGLFKNGVFPTNSLGKSSRLSFTNYGLKTGATLKISGKHLVNLNAGYYSKPPTLRNSFSNSRQNNEVVTNLKSEKIASADVGYIYRSSAIKFRLTGYFSKITDATQVSFYYTDGLSGLGRESTTAFVQEILQGIDKQYFGGEMGFEAQLIPTLKFKAAAAIGQFTYSNNPQLYLTSNTIKQNVSYGEVYLKDYHLNNGPQTAAQLGFEYRDPDYWWLGFSVNYFSHGYAGISPLIRTSNFVLDTDGLPLLNYDEGNAKKILRQEQFDDYYLVNMVGGKSWRIKKNYIGFFISLNNIFDVLYKTGAYEQSRNANYTNLKEDREREFPVFGTKYWYGKGASYYANIYVRF